MHVVALVMKQGLMCSLNEFQIKAMQQCQMIHAFIVLHNSQMLCRLAFVLVLMLRVLLLLVLLLFFVLLIFLALFAMLTSCQDSQCLLHAANLLSSCTH